MRVPIAVAWESAFFVYLSYNVLIVLDYNYRRRTGDIVYTMCEYIAASVVCAECQQFMQTRCREQIEQTCRERDQAVLDVQSLERAFSDLHRRFDKSKQIITNAEKVLVHYSLLYASEDHSLQS